MLYSVACIIDNQSVTTRIKTSRLCDCIKLNMHIHFVDQIVQHIQRHFSVTCSLVLFVINTFKDPWKDDWRRDPVGGGGGGVGGGVGGQFPHLNQVE